MKFIKLSLFPYKNTLLLCLLVLLFSQCQSTRKSGTSNAAANSKVEIPENLYPSPDLIVAGHSVWTKGHYPRMIASYKKDPLQMHDIVFLGNSITQQGGDWGKRLNNPTIKNRGISGDVTDGVIERLGEITYVKPKAVFLEIGINDLFNSSLSAQRTADNIIKISKIIHDKSPRTRIYIQTIFPTRADHLIAKIRETNSLIRNSKNKTFKIVETHALFVDEQGKMKTIYSTDGVHLNEAGYEIWVNHLRLVLSPLAVRKVL